MGVRESRPDAPLPVAPPGQWSRRYQRGQRCAPPLPDSFARARCPIIVPLLQRARYSSSSPLMHFLVEQKSPGSLAATASDDARKPAPILDSGAVSPVTDRFGSRDGLETGAFNRDRSLVQWLPAGDPDHGAVNRHWTRRSIKRQRHSMDGQAHGFQRTQWTSNGKFQVDPTSLAIRHFNLKWFSGTLSTSAPGCHGMRERIRISFTLAVSARLMPVIASPLARKSAL